MQRRYKESLKMSEESELTRLFWRRIKELECGWIVRELCLKGEVHTLVDLELLVECVRYDQLVFAVIVQISNFHTTSI